MARSILLAGFAAKEAVFDLVLPPACRLCDVPVGANQDFCRACEAALTLSEPMMRSACLRCGVPKPQVSGAPDRSDCDEDLDSAICSPDALAPCLHCKSITFEFTGVTTLWSYQDRVCEAVVAAKYAHQSPLGDALGRRLGARVSLAFGSDLPDLVTFVPSHLTRQLSRGGNGNLAVASAVALTIGRPCRPLMRTTRKIAKQAWLDDTERRENVRDAFSLKKSYALLRPLGLADRHVLVVDDVLTTGATANEVAQVLREGGARRVTLAVVARAVRSQ